MFLKSVNQSLPTDTDRPPLLSRPPDVGQRASHGYAQAGAGCWLCYFILAVHVSPLTSLFHSMDQRVGCVCLMGTWEKTQTAFVI